MFHRLSVTVSSACTRHGATASATSNAALRAAARRTARHGTRDTGGRGSTVVQRPMTVRCVCTCSTCTRPTRTRARPTHMRLNETFGATNHVPPRKGSGIIATRRPQATRTASGRGGAAGGENAARQKAANDQRQGQGATRDIHALCRPKCKSEKLSN